MKNRVWVKKQLINMVADWWKDLLSVWLDMLIEEWYDIKYITYIKEKYWTLRIEWPYSQIIQDIEVASQFICEECGAIWKTRFDLWWYRTLCNKHYNLIKNNEIIK
jgi:hypothetical protein